MTIGPVSAPQAPRGWRFEDFEVDAQRSTLHCAGMRVTITPKAMEALIHLLRNHGQTVSRAELLEVVWAGAAVEENTIAVTIGALRRALRERASEARFVITVPGSGYRFVADVEPLVSESTAKPTPMRLQPLAGFSDVWSVSVPEVADWHVPFEPTSEVAGRTMGQWLVLWWKHVLERPAHDHPLLDEVADSDAAVVDGMALLFSTWLPIARVERRCRVPAGCPVLIPIKVANVDNAGLPAAEYLPEPEMLGVLRKIANDMTDLALEVDGTSIPNLRRFRTGPQRLAYAPRPDSLYHRLGLAPPPIVEPAFCDGYLAILPPPPPGEHLIRFAGTHLINGTRFTRDVIYHLFVQSP